MRASITPFLKLLPAFALALLMVAGPAHAYQLLGAPATSTTTTVACDIGPPYQGHIPEPAAQFGLTHCLNFDFSYTGTFQNQVPFYPGYETTVQIPAGQTYQWSNKATWLDSAGAGANALFRQNAGTPSQFQLVTDTDGKQSLLEQILPTDTSQSGIGSPAFPTTNHFLMFQYRYDTNNSSNFVHIPNGDPNGNFEYYTSPHGYTLETDFGATEPQSYAPGVSNSGTGVIMDLGAIAAGGGEIDAPAGHALDADTNMHMIGSLIVASESANTLAYCGYVDYLLDNTFGGSGGNCRHLSDPPRLVDPGICNSPSIMCYQSGLELMGIAVDKVSAPVHIWVRRVVIWVPPTWNAVPDSNPQGWDPATFSPIPADGGNAASWTP